MSDVIEVSYTGDLLAHRRCRRAWAYEKHAGFVPYEQVQAMEGRLLHHGMEWLSREFAATRNLATRSELRQQLEHYYRVLRSRGITTAFSSRDEVLERILDNLYAGETKMHRAVSAVIRGAVHTEYPLRSVKKVLPAKFAGKSKIMLTGIIDLVTQQPDALTYHRVWRWTDEEALEGKVVAEEIAAAPGDEEIWDFKASKAKTHYLIDYVRQVVTYAGLYRERTGRLPSRCVIYFVNERDEVKGLLAVPVDDNIVDAAVEWTVGEVEQLRATTLDFESDPLSIEGGSALLRDQPIGDRVDDDLKAQCTGCGQRFDCGEYVAHLGPGKAGEPKRDVDPLAVGRN